MRIGVVTGWFLLALAGATRPVSAQSSSPPEVGIDHVILATTSLTRGIETFARRTGVTPERGGAHPGRGTENALIALGEGRYLELLAPVTPPAGASSSDAQLVPAGWALHTRDLTGVIARLKAAGFDVAGPLPGSRRKPDGTLLQWQTATVDGTGLELAPFFIQWDPAGAHPSATSPSGCRLVSLEIVTAEGERLAAFFQAVGFAASLGSRGERGLHLTLRCASGEVVF